MTWEPASEVDEQVRTWFEQQGWSVSSTHYDFDREMYAWRHEAPGVSYTIWATREALELPASAHLAAFLEKSRAAVLLREKPGAYTVVRQAPGAGLVLQQLAKLPD